MGFLKNALKTGVVVKVLDVVRREAAKPQNQEKARRLVDRVSRRAARDRRDERGPAGR
jgi:hypothetical protein